MAGILIGPGVMGLVPEALIARMDFVSDIALAFIAFGVGQYFRRDTLGETGKGLLLVTMLESLLPGVLAALAMRFLFRQNLALSLLLGAILRPPCPQRHISKAIPLKKHS